MHSPGKILPNGAALALTLAMAGCGGGGGTNSADSGPDTFVFATATPDRYARVDRMGQPAVATALLLELRDRRVRAPEDAVLALGLPVLGTLPKPGAKRYLTGKRSALAAPQRLGLPTPETEA